MQGNNQEVSPAIDADTHTHTRRRCHRTLTHTELIMH